MPPTTAPLASSPIEDPPAGGAVAALRQVLDSTPHAIVTFDAQGRVIESNRAATQLFGHPREALAMLTLPDLLRGRRLDPAASLPTLLGNEGGRVIGSRIEALALHADGRSISARVRACSTIRRRCCSAPPA